MVWERRRKHITGNEWDPVLDCKVAPWVGPLFFLRGGSFLQMPTHTYPWPTYSSSESTTLHQPKTLVDINNWELEMLQEAKISAKTNHSLFCNVKFTFWSSFPQRFFLWIHNISVDTTLNFLHAKYSLAHPNTPSFFDKGSRARLPCERELASVYITLNFPNLSTDPQRCTFSSSLQIKSSYLLLPPTVFL